MIKINLLPPEEQKKSRVQQKKILAGLAGGLVAFLFIGYWGFNVFRLNSLESKIEHVNRELAKIKPVVQEVEALEKSKADLQKRRNVIKTLLTGRQRYPKLMTEIVALLPGDIWIQSLRTQVTHSAITLEFRAKSFNNFAIADWIMNMEESPLFNNIDLKTIQKSGSGSDVVLDFGIKCNYSGS